MYLETEVGLKPRAPERCLGREESALWSSHPGLSSVCVCMCARACTGVCVGGGVGVRDDQAKARQPRGPLLPIAACLGPAQGLWISDVVNQCPQEGSVE